jgi:cation diffusion facilitator family transporter
MSTTKQKYGYIAGTLSVVVNISLFGLKIWAGLIVGSVALVADAWHTLSDTLTSAIVIVGFMIAGKPPDKEHPYGHGRAELIGAIIISTLLAVVGITFFRESIEQLRQRQAVHYGAIGLWVLIVSIVTKEVLAQITIFLAKKSDSPSLRADAWHHRTDAVSSVIILVGLFFSGRFWWVDGAAGIGVSAMILYAAYDILMDASHTLLGEPLDSKTREKIEEIIGATSGKTGQLHHIHIHKYGEHIEITLHLKFPPAMTIHDAHTIATEIEQAIGQRLGMECTIHLEPADISGQQE